MTVEVRELKTKDLYTLTKILNKLKDKGLKEVLSNAFGLGMMQNVVKTNVEADKEGEEVTDEALEMVGQQATMDILWFVVENAEEATREFFADLIGMTPEEYDNTPIDTAIDIIRQLSEKEEIKRFFKKALELSNNSTRA